MADLPGDNENNEQKKWSIESSMDDETALPWCVLLVGKTEDPLNINWPRCYHNMLTDVVNQDFKAFGHEDLGIVVLDDEGFACWAKASSPQTDSEGEPSNTRVNSFADYAYMVYACVVIGEHVDDWLEDQIDQVDAIWLTETGDARREEMSEAFTDLSEMAESFYNQLEFETVKKAFESGDVLDLITAIALGASFRVDMD